MLQPQSITSKMILTSVVACVLLSMICGALLTKRGHEKLATCIGCLLIIIEPLLFHRRVTWPVGEDPVQLQQKEGLYRPANDTQFVLLMLLTAVLFLGLVPVRALFSWVVPAAVTWCTWPPLCYFFLMEKQLTLSMLQS